MSILAVPAGRIALAWHRLLFIPQAAKFSACRIFINHYKPYKPYKLYNFHKLVDRAGIESRFHRDFTDNSNLNFRFLKLSRMYCFVFNDFKCFSNLIAFDLVSNSLECNNLQGLYAKVDFTLPELCLISLSLTLFICPI